MKWNSALALGTLFATLVVAPPAFAQGLGLLRDNGAPPDSPWQHGTTADVIAGAASTSEQTRGAIGGGFGWEINHWVEMEVSGTWLLTQQGNEAFAANLKTFVNLTRPNVVVPFLGAGVGLYHASFDTTRGDIPAFYQSRLPAGSIGSLATFNDPALVFDGGVNIFASRHFSLRPDFSVTVVPRSSSSYAVRMAVLHATYHFEAHGIGQ